MGKAMIAAGMALVTATIGLLLMVAVVAGAGSAGGGAIGSRGSGAPGSGGIDPTPAIPAAWSTLYRHGAATCPGLPWSVLAAIGTVETGNGQSNAPGVWSGANSAGAEGPLQLEPDTFAAYATVGPGGALPATPYDPVDAVYTASKLLCQDGAGSPGTLRAAVGDYNHSVVYVNTVLTLAMAFGDAPQLTGTVVAVLSFAARQLDVPYRWGGTGTGGFDCSGLTQAAYTSGGIALPRVAQGQFDAGPAVPSGSTVHPGDLIFFGSGTTGVDHVGLYIGDGEMIDAPHAGALVRFDSAHWPGLVGATRPAA